MRLRFVLLAASGCGFSMHSSFSTSSSGGGSSPDPTPVAQTAPVAEPAAPAKSQPPSKRVRDTGPPGDPAPVFASAPAIDAPGPLAAADWSGSYDGDPLSCDGVTQFDPKGPDVQTFRTDGWNYSPGFKCPFTCVNPTKATLAKGKLSFPLVWVDDHPPEDAAGKYTITMRRYRIDVPLGKTDDATVKSGLLTYKTAPFKWSHNNIYEMRSDGVIISAGVQKVADKHTGSGRLASIKLALHDPAPGAPEYEWLTDAEAGCSQMLSRDDWKAGDGLSDDDGGEETASSSPSASHAHGDGGARQKCKSSCRSAAGSCRTACHGSSAKCASNCNHDESSCERSCG